MEKPNLPTILHLGCSNQSLPDDIFSTIFPNGFEEIRVDIDPNCRHDITADIRKLPIADKSVDCVYAAHVLEHFDSRERWPLLREWKRVVRDTGLIYVVVPRLDSKVIIDALNEGDIDKVTYVSPAGPITACQMVFGQYYEGTYEIHRWGYTAKTLTAFLSNFVSGIVYMDQELQICCYGWVGQPESGQNNNS